MNSKNAGFTLIELMIVLAIISILSTMAIPSYQDRAIRAQVQEALALADIATDKVEEYYKAKRMLPKDNTLASLPASDKIIGNYVTRLNINNGVINITLGNRINVNAQNKIISIRPAIVESEPMVPIAWVFGYASVPEGMTVIGENETTLLKRHLPMNGRF